MHGLETEFQMNILALLALQTKDGNTAAYYETVAEAVELYVSTINSERS